jgi:hypothetical protein
MSRIDNTFAAQKLDRTQDTQGAQGSSRRAGILETPPQESVAHIPAPELQQALDRLRQIPELRQDLLEQVTRRLSGQNLLTPAAAAQTAAAILAETGTTLLQTPAPSSSVATPPAAEEAAPGAPVDLLQLQETLRQIPLLRQEVVGEVAQRLANGQLTTPAANDLTVKAIMETVGRSA